MHGDILKFYRHTQIPLTDYIFYYGHGRDGFKQVGSAADLYDRPLVGAELCGAFDAAMDSLMLYRVTLDLFARGVNYLVPHGMWYDPAPEHVRIPPLISPYNPTLAPALKRYSDFAARSCAMLQGGRAWPMSRYFTRLRRLRPDSVSAAGTNGARARLRSWTTRG